MSKRNGRDMYPCNSILSPHGKEFGWTGVGWTPLLRTLTDAKADTQPEDTQW